MMSRLKSFLQDFPGTNAGHAAAILLILLTGLIACIRLALGKPFPAGYDGWLALLAALSGVSTIGVIGKRFTDVNYRAAGTSPVTVEAPSTVKVTAPAPVAPSADEDKR